MADPTAPDASAQNTESSPSLRAAGLRQTPQREAILRVLNESDRPLSAEEVWRSMGGQ
jgi:Fe2+ or Zn2+ uptake regulation protein